MTTVPIIRTPMPRKLPVKRLFSGVAGSPLATVLGSPVPTTEPAPVDAALMEPGKMKSESSSRLVGRPLDEPAPDPFADRIPLPPLVVNLKSKAESRAEKAKLRAQKWREKRRQIDPDFKGKEKKRKQSERTETGRKQALNALLESGQHPTSVERLRTKNGPALSIVNKYGHKVSPVSGGYDPEQIEKMQTEQKRVEGGNSIFTPPAKPKGEAKPDEDADSVKSAPRPSKFKYLRPRDVKKMFALIEKHTTESPMMVCLVCREQIAPRFSFEQGYMHFYNTHAALYEDMVRQAQKTKQCPEDHAGMIARHGTGTRKLYCGKCGKLLYEPPKPPKQTEPQTVRTDKTCEALIPDNSMTTEHIAVL